jgi:hypothetical protein
VNRQVWIDKACTRARGAQERDHLKLNRQRALDLW